MSKEQKGGWGGMQQGRQAGIKPRVLWQVLSTW